MLIKLHTLCQKESFVDGAHEVTFYWREGLYPVFRLAIHEIHEFDDQTPDFPSGAMMVGDVLGGLARVRENYFDIRDAIAYADIEQTIIEVTPSEGCDPDEIGDEDSQEDDDSIELDPRELSSSPSVIEPRGTDPVPPSQGDVDTSAGVAGSPSASEPDHGQTETHGSDPK